MRAVLNSEKDTITFGKKLAAKLHGGDILCLYGDLGAGKTTLAKGIAAGLGIKKGITSPTFALMNVYDCHSRPPRRRNPNTVMLSEAKHPINFRGSFASLRMTSKLDSRFRENYSDVLVHIDTYRLKDAQELIDIGAEDYLGQSDAICVIEWPEKIANLLKGKKIVSIKLSHTKKQIRQIDIPADLT